MGNSFCCDGLGFSERYGVNDAQSQRVLEALPCTVVDMRPGDILALDLDEAHSVYSLPQSDAGHGVGHAERPSPGERRNRPMVSTATHMARGQHPFTSAPPPAPAAARHVAAEAVTATASATDTARRPEPTSSDGGVVSTGGARARPRDRVGTRSAGCSGAVAEEENKCAAQAHDDVTESTGVDGAGAEFEYKFEYKARTRAYVSPARNFQKKRFCDDDGVCGEKIIQKTSTQ